MSERPYLTPLDLKLLRQLARHPNLSVACRLAGIGRDQGQYRLRRLARLYGHPVASTRRGGGGVGGTRLNRWGLRLLEQDPRTRRRGPESRLTGVFHRGPPPTLRTLRGLSLAVGFLRAEGERVRVEVDPEAILLAPLRFPSSARNVLVGVLTRLHAQGSLRRIVSVRVGRETLNAAVTPAAVSELRLRPGRRIYLYLKATAVKPLAPPRLPLRPRTGRAGHLRSASS